MDKVTFMCQPENSMKPSGIKGFRNKGHPPMSQDCLLSQCIHSFNQKLLKICYVSSTVLHTGKTDIYETESPHPQGNS